MGNNEGEHEDGISVGIFVDTHVGIKEGYCDIVGPLVS